LQRVPAIDSACSPTGMNLAQSRTMSGLITLTVALAAALYLCWLMLQPFVNVLLWASVLTVVFYPMHRRIRARLQSATAAAAASTLLVLILILVPVTVLTIAVVRELSGAAAKLQDDTQLFSNGGTPLLAWLLDRVGEYVAIDRESARRFVAERMQLWGAALASSTLVVVGGVVGAIVQMGLVMFSMFYLFRDGERLRHALYGMLPLQRMQAHEITVRTRDVIAATIYGVLVISAIQGTLGTMIFWFLGLPSPLLWGVVMFFLSMIPMAGSFLVWVPAAGYLALTGEYTKAAILVGWGILVIGSIDNFLSPKLVGQRARLHELLIFFAVLGGLEVFGVLGLVLGPVVVAITLALIEMVREAHRPPAQTLSEPTVLEEQSALRDVS
jgi:predicted PurR-regulated permease PerM